MFQKMLQVGGGSEDIDFGVPLFKNGKQYETITGGWTGNGYSAPGNTHHNGTITDGKLTGNGNSYSGNHDIIIGTANAIDFTSLKSQGYKKIYVVGKSVDSYIFVNSNKVVTDAAAITIWSYLDNGETCSSYDIPDGNLYLAFVTFAGNRYFEIPYVFIY